MAQILVTRDDIIRDTREWRHVVRLMEDTKADFEGVSTAVLPPSVQAVGQSFVQAWAGFAGEAVADAGDIVEALEQTLKDFDGTDEEEGRRYKLPIPPVCGEPVPRDRIYLPQPYDPGDLERPLPVEPDDGDDLVQPLPYAPDNLTSRLGDLP